MKSSKTILPIMIMASSLHLTACGGGEQNNTPVFPNSDLIYRADAVVDGTYELFSTTETGDEQYSLTQNSFGAGVATDIQVSPDGRYVAFRAYGEQPNVRELYVDDLNDNQPPIKVSGDLVAGGDVIRFKWSPKSERLAYLADQEVNERDELYTVRPNGEELTKVNGNLVPGGSVRISAFTLDADDFAWSPNGQRLAYVADQDEDDKFELYTVLPNGTANTKISGNMIASGDVVGFRWSPDSQRIAYRADQEFTNRYELYSTLAIGLINAKINGDLALNGYVSDKYEWSADSAYIAYTAEQDTADKFELYTAGPTGANKTRVSDLPDDGINTVSTFKWSPVNNRLVYRAYEPGPGDDASELYSVLYTGAQHNLLTDPMATDAVVDISYAWAPDGSRIAFISDEEVLGRDELYTVSPTGLARVKINSPLEAGGDVLFFKWSPDSQWLAYQADQETNNVSELFTATPTGQDITKVNGVLVAGGNVSPYNFRWSPDSAKLAYIADQDNDEVAELYTSDVTGMNNVKVSGPLGPNGNVTLFRWRP